MTLEQEDTVLTARLAQLQSAVDNGKRHIALKQERLEEYLRELRELEHA